MISPFTSFIYFVGLTTVYFTLKYFLSEKHGAKNKGLGIALTVVYLIVMVLLQFGTNMKNATEKCGGTPQTFAAFNYTVMPNLFIFGVLLMIMSIINDYVVFSRLEGSIFKYIRIYNC